MLSPRIKTVSRYPSGSPFHFAIDQREGDSVIDAKPACDLRDFLSSFKKTKNEFYVPAFLFRFFCTKLKEYYKAHFFLPKGILCGQILQNFNKHLHSMTTKINSIVLEDERKQFKKNWLFERFHLASLWKILLGYWFILRNWLAKGDMWDSKVWVQGRFDCNSREMHRNVQ